MTISGIRISDRLRQEREAHRRTIEKLTERLQRLGAPASPAYEEAFDWVEKRMADLTEDARVAGEASTQAAFWRSRAIELGADPNEYKLPVCALHGKQHKCLYCCICFKPLTPEECAVDNAGQKWDCCPGECAREAGLT